jgi:hypothetical protein
VNTGQSFLVIGAFVLLSTLTLNVNATLINTSSTGLEMEATLDAVSIAQTLLDEILVREFDEKTVGGIRIYSPNDMTPSYSLGVEGSEAIVGDHGVDTSKTGKFESKTKFDDVDDYKGYQRKAWNPRFGWFNVSVRVSYVDEDDPNDATTHRSFYKRVTITVTQPNLVKDMNNNVIPYVVQDLAVYRKYF